MCIYTKIRSDIITEFSGREMKYFLLNADTLCEFVSKCKSEKTGHIRTIEERKPDMIAREMEKHA